MRTEQDKRTHSPFSCRAASSASAPTILTAASSSDGGRAASERCSSSPVAARAALGGTGLQSWEDASASSRRRRLLQTAGLVRKDSRVCLEKTRGGWKQVNHSREGKGKNVRRTVWGWLHE